MSQFLVTSVLPPAADERTFSHCDQSRSTRLLSDIKSYVSLLKFI